MKRLIFIGLAVLLVFPPALFAEMSNIRQRANMDQQEERAPSQGDFRGRNLDNPHLDGDYGITGSLIVSSLFFLGGLYSLNNAVEEKDSGAAKNDLHSGYIGLGLGFLILDFGVHSALSDIKKPSIAVGRDPQNRYTMLIGGYLF